ARPALARAGSEAHGGDPANYERYLARDIRYQLGAEELSGLSAFFDRARAAGLLTRAVRPRLFEARPRLAPAPIGAPSRSIDSLLADAAAGTRLSPDAALRLYAEAPALELGAAADARRQALHP